MLSRRGSLAGALLVGTLASGQAVLGQVPDSPSEATAIPVGRVFLYPLFSSSVERTDNLFMLSSDVQAANITTIAPGVIADMPFSNSSVRLGYVGSRRDYHTVGIETNDSHYFVGNARLKFGSGFELSLKEDYQRGMLDTLGVDPGGNLIFRGERYELNATEAELALERTSTKRIALSFGRDVRNVLGDRLSGIYDAEEYHGKLSGEHRLGMRTWMLWEGNFARTHLTWPPEYREGASIYEDDDNLRVGTRFLLSPATVLNALAGWSRTRFTGDASGAFRGVVGNANVRWTRPTGETVEFGFARVVYPLLVDAEDVEPYYLSTQYHVEASTGNLATLSLGVTAYYYVNDFPSDTSTRTDRVGNAEIWAGYRYHGWMECRVYLSKGRRDSTEPGFDYRVTRYGALLRIGS